MSLNHTPTAGQKTLMTLRPIRIVAAIIGGAAILLAFTSSRSSAQAVARPGVIEASTPDARAECATSIKLAGIFPSLDK